MPRSTDDATHWVHPEESVSRYGQTTAICGARVNVHWGDVDDQAPTCARCQAWLAERNAPQPGDLEVKK